MIEFINNDTEYWEAMNRIIQLVDAERRPSECEELNILVDLVFKYKGDL